MTEGNPSYSVLYIKLVVGLFLLINGFAKSVHKQKTSKNRIYTVIKMNTFLRNTISKLYDDISVPVAATRDALAERL